MQYLRASTAATVLVGPAVDATDGVTEETGLSTGSADAIGIMKHDGTLAADISGTTTLTHRTNGYYTSTLSTADTNTVGRLVWFLSEAATCLPFRHEFMVLPANVYDSLVSGSDTLSVTSTTVSNEITVDLVDKRSQKFPRGYQREGNELDLVAFKSTAGVFEFTVTGRDGKPEDLTGASMRFNVYAADASVASWTEPGVVTGRNSNEIAVSFTADDVATTGTFAYALIRTSDDRIFKHGELEIRNIITGAA